MPVFWEHRRNSRKTKYPGLAQLVARLLWEQDVGSSSLPSRTKKREKPSEMAVFLRLEFYELES